MQALVYIISGINIDLQTIIIVKGYFINCIIKQLSILQPEI